MTRISGFRNDGYADNASLVLIGPAGADYTEAGIADTIIGTIN